MADSSKTEQATPRRRLKAREQGRVTRSRELTSALSLFAVAGALSLTARNGAAQWTNFFRITLESASTDNIETNGPLLYWTSIEALRWIVPILCLRAGGIACRRSRPGRLCFRAGGTCVPKSDRISPVNKMQQIFSPAGLSNILKSLIPFSGILWVGVACLSSHWGQILGSSSIEPRAFVTLVGQILLELSWKSSLVLLIWAGADYMLLRMKNEGDMKMSRQEIREEMKDTDGNPANKARIRKLQRQARRRRMIKATETATVVITNPTHYAVALKFEFNMSAPVVVAKGLDLLAAQIKQIARDRGIPIMENRSLAQALYKSVEVGDAIPSALYHAVAEILVLVYKAQDEVKRREAQRRASVKN